MGRSPSSASSSSASAADAASALRATATTLSPEARFISRTPIVCRRDRFTSAAAVLMTPRAEEIAALFADLGGTHAHRAPPLDRVLVDRGALGVAARGGDQHVRALAHH